MHEAGFAACVKHGRYLRHDDGTLKRYWHPIAARCAAMAATRESGGQELSLIYLTDDDLADGVRDADDKFSRQWRAKPRSGRIERAVVTKTVSFFDWDPRAPREHRPK